MNKEYYVIINTNFFYSSKMKGKLPIGTICKVIEDDITWTLFSLDNQSSWSFYQDSRDYEYIKKYLTPIKPSKFLNLLFKPLQEHFNG